MPLLIIRNDITKVDAEAIVCPTDRFYSGSGGTDLAIHDACGGELRELCGALPPCLPGEAHATEAPGIRAKYILHTVGPVWHGGSLGEAETLRQCYESCLRLADELKLTRIAFPIISSGAFGFPKALALRIARETLSLYLQTHDAELLLVVYDQTSFEAGLDLFGAVQSYISAVRPPEVLRSAFMESRILSPRTKDRSRRADRGSGPDDRDLGIPLPSSVGLFEEELLSADDHEKKCLTKAEEDPAFSFLPFSETELRDLAEAADESFGKMLLRKIDERKMTDSECYHRANIDRRLFNKIKNNPGYHPSKQTVLAFAVALKLTLTETNELLMKAGFSLSRSFTFDIIVEYCISHSMYDIFRINELLFSFDQSLLGA